MTADCTRFSAVNAAARNQARSDRSDTSRDDDDGDDGEPANDNECCSRLCP